MHRHRQVCGHLLSAATLLAAAPLACADSTTVLAAKDTSIFSNNVNNSDGGGPGLFAGVDGNASKLRSLIEFNLAASVPAGSTITGVQLTLFLGMVVGNGGGGGGSDTTPRIITLHRLTDDWGEGTNGSPSTTISNTGAGFAAATGDATWNARFYSATSPTNWTTPGGDFSATASGSTPVSQSVGSAYTWSSTPAMVSDAQTWLDTPSSNFGWLLQNTDEADLRTFRSFWSREASNSVLRPQLLVSYAPVPEPSAIVGCGAMMCGAILRRNRRSI